MDAKLLSWLADTVKEAIAEAVKPLHAEIETLRKQIPAAYDDTGLRDQIKTLLNPEVQDDTFYDDIWWKIEDRVKDLLPAPYDDAALRQQVADLTTRTNAHAEIVKGYADNLPKPYDDSELRAEVTRLSDVLGKTAPLGGLHAVEEDLGKLRSELKSAPAPRNGTDGRDALQLEILPAIDEQKSYQRGTYAKHAGGLWRSFEQTHGMRGWECIVTGVKSVGARWEGKTLIETTTLSDGVVHETRKSFSVQEYKGVFVPSSEYDRGDTVTWAGSLWHCNVTGTKALPGDGSADWTLAVKKGRDGKDVVTLPKGEPQPVKIGGAQ